MANLGTMTGNRANIKLGGIAVGVGIIQNLNASDDFGLQDVDGLGLAESVELAHGKISHSISMSKVFFYNKMLKDLGYVPNVNTILSIAEFEVEVIDVPSQSTLELYTGAKIGSCSRSYGKHTLCMEDVQIRAIHKEV